MIDTIATLEDARFTLAEARAAILRSAGWCLTPARAVRNTAAEIQLCLEVPRGRNQLIEFLSDEDIARIKELASTLWMRADHYVHWANYMRRSPEARPESSAFSLEHTNRRAEIVSAISDLLPTLASLTEGLSEPAETSLPELLHQLRTDNDVAQWVATVRKIRHLVLQVLSAFDYLTDDDGNDVSKFGKWVRRDGTNKAMTALTPIDLFIDMVKFASEQEARTYDPAALAALRREAIRTHLQHRAEIILWVGKLHAFMSDNEVRVGR